MKTSISDRSPLSPTLWPPDAFRWWFSLVVAVALFAAALVPAAIFVAFLVAFKLASLHELRDPRSLTWPALAGQLVSYAVSLALLGVLLPALAHRSLPELGLRRLRRIDVAWGLGGAVAMVLLATATGAVQDVVLHVKPDEVQVHWLRDARGPMIAGFALLACIAAPFFEELTFRGFIFNALLRYLPAWGAVLGSSLLFGLAHWQPGNAGAIAPLIAGGIVLACVYYRTGSLFASMITHSLFNTFTVVLVVGLHQT